MGSQDNIDKSIDASHNSGRQWFHLEVSEDAKKHIVVCLLAISIVVNIACLWMFDIMKSEMRLKEYDLDNFRATEFAQLKAEVHADASANQKIVTILTNSRR